MFQLMLFMFFFFLGSIIMFWCVMRKLDAQTRIFGDEHAQLRVLLRAMESRLDKIGQLERINAMLQGKEEDAQFSAEIGPTEQTSGHDPLLHLSFDQPPVQGNQIDPGLDLNMETSPIWPESNNVSTQKSERSD